MKNKITLDLILSKVSDYYNESKENICGKTKKGKLAYIRQIYCFISRKITDEKLMAIALTINRDHSTVMFSVSKIESEKEIYLDIKNDLNSILKSIFSVDFIIERVDLLSDTEIYTKSLN